MRHGDSQEAMHLQWSPGVMEDQRQALPDTAYTRLLGSGSVNDPSGNDLNNNFGYENQNSRLKT